MVQYKLQTGVLQEKGVLYSGDNWVSAGVYEIVVNRDPGGEVKAFGSFDAKSGRIDPNLPNAALQLRTRERVKLKIGGSRGNCIDFEIDQASIRICEKLAGSRLAQRRTSC